MVIPWSAPLSLEGGDSGQSVASGLASWLTTRLQLRDSAGLCVWHLVLSTHHRLRLFALVSDPKGTTTGLVYSIEKLQVAVPIVLQKRLHVNIARRRGAEEVPGENRGVRTWLHHSACVLHAVPRLDRPSKV
jgi:hypothetical protein